METNFILPICIQILNKYKTVFAFLLRPGNKYLLKEEIFSPEYNFNKSVILIPFTPIFDFKLLFQKLFRK